jgi:galactose mutarotase-like enzyme
MPTAGGKNRVKMVEIKNQYFKVGVLLKGAELCSLKKIQTCTEYIWQADQEIWSSHAPNLFPIIGALKDGEVFYEEIAYPLTRHGFIRNNEHVKLKEQSEERLVFQLSFSEETLKLYPFKFDFQISFTLNDRTLTISHKITSLDNKPMYFSLGGHPAFNAPLFEGETYEDYYLEFDQKLNLKTHLFTDEGLISEKTAIVTRNDNKIWLNKGLFDNDALIFKNILSKEVALKSKNKGTILTVQYNDFKHLGIWAIPAAPFVCIEPWLGYADVEETTKDLKTKKGIMELMPSETFNASYAITIA